MNTQPTTSGSTPAKAAPAAAPKIGTSRTPLQAGTIVRPKMASFAPVQVTPLRPPAAIQAPQSLRTQITPIVKTPTIPMRPLLPSSIRAPLLSGSKLPGLTPVHSDAVGQRGKSVTPVHRVTPSSVVKVTEGASRIFVQNTQKRMLSLESKFNGDFIINRHPLILDIEHPTDPGETGFRVWDAGVVMAKYIESQKDVVPKKRVLELGCGSGISGISWALCGHDVVLTDREAIKQRTEKNVQENRLAVIAEGGSLAFEVLEWNDAAKFPHKAGEFDVVLASDVIWANVFIEPFLNALSAVTNETTQIMMAHKSRSDDLDTAFLAACPSKGFKLVETICPTTVLEGKYALDIVKIYVLRRVAEVVGEEPVVVASAEKAVVDQELAEAAQAEKPQPVETEPETAAQAEPALAAVEVESAKEATDAVEVETAKEATEAVEVESAKEATEAVEVETAKEATEAVEVETAKEATETVEVETAKEATEEHAEVTQVSEAAEAAAGVNEVAEKMEHSGEKAEDADSDETAADADDVGVC